MAHFEADKSDRKACDDKIDELQQIADNDPDPTRRRHARKFIEQMKLHRDTVVKDREDRARARGE
jgi:hypothetical protein